MICQERGGRMISTDLAVSIIKHNAEQQAIPLDKVKQAREEIENEIKFWSEPSKYNVKPIVAIKNAKAQSYKHCLEILDKLIESEENE